MATLLGGGDMDGVRCCRYTPARQGREEGGGEKVTLCERCSEILGGDVRNVPYGFGWFGWDIVKPDGVPQHALVSPCAMSMLTVVELCQIDKQYKELAQEAHRQQKMKEEDIAEAVAAERERCVPYDYLRECLGEVLHTAFRKGGQSKEADRIWHIIMEMPMDDWGHVVDWVVWCIQTSRNAAAIHAGTGEGEQVPMSDNQS